MKWPEMQKPLEQGFQAFRMAWSEDRYVEKTEGGRNQLFWESSESFLEEAYEPTQADLNASDWCATGPGGE